MLEDIHADKINFHRNPDGSENTVLAQDPDETEE